MRDALAMLAHVYLRFGRPSEAAALLAALALLDEDPGWALRTRCFALLRAGLYEAARAETLRLLDAPLDDSERAPLLRILAKANWRLGRDEEARVHQIASQAATSVEVSRRPLRGPSR
jgi:hypothetical protein